jgi:hypothetical protein
MDSSVFPGLTSIGLTKRELFAAMAMQSIIAKAPLEDLRASDPGHLPRECALGAVDYADALLEALKTHPETQP